MRMRMLAMVSLTMVALTAGDVWAKRAGPKEVEPVVADGVKYVASNDSGREGKVEARDAKTDKKLWEVVVYTVKIDPELEEDVQWVFITRLAVKENALLVTNEKGEAYKVDLTTKKVEKVEQKGDK